MPVDCVGGTIWCWGGNLGGHLKMFRFVQPFGQAAWKVARQLGLKCDVQTLLQIAQRCLPLTHGELNRVKISKLFSMLIYLLVFFPIRSKFVSLLGFGMKLKFTLIPITMLLQVFFQLACCFTFDCPSMNQSCAHDRITPIAHFILTLVWASRKRHFCGLGAVCCTQCRMPK